MWGIITVEVCFSFVEMRFVLLHKLSILQDILKCVLVLELANSNFKGFTSYFADMNIKGF